MSQGSAVQLEHAQSAALELAALLAPACERIEVAGSVRRRKPVVHDLELVAIPRQDHRPVPGLFETTWADVDLLAEKVRGLREDGVIQLRDVVVERRDGTTEISHRDGAAYKALEYVGLPVDLFITDAERWGCIFALRTGPGTWNVRLVTECKRWFRRVEDGRVLHLGRPVPTPEEADFFRALGVPWLEPEDRHPDRLRFDPALLAEGAR